jgi:hypothetical protein
VPIPRYAFILGAMKSGTTTLFNYLDQHSAIAGATPKEPSFFAFDDVFAQGRDWYDGLFGFDPARHVWALDGSTDYTKSPFCGDVRARMASFADAEFRGIYLMRHPLRRIESHARHTQWKKRELGRTLSDRPDHGLDSGVSPVNLACSRYAEQLDVYRDWFDAGRVKLMTLEDFSADPHGQTAAACAFLGLDPPERLVRPENDNRAGSKRRQSPLERRIRAIPGVSALGRLLVGPDLRKAIRYRMAKPIVAQGRFALTAEEEAALLDELRPDLVRLRDVYGLDAARVWNIPL